MEKPHRGMRDLDDLPIVTHESANPETLTITLSAQDDVYDLRMDSEVKAERLHYLLDRALDPANEPPRYPKRDDGQIPRHGREQITLNGPPRTKG